MAGVVVTIPGAPVSVSAVPPSYFNEGALIPGLTYSGAASALAGTGPGGGAIAGSIPGL